MQHVFSPMFEEREMAKPSTVFLESETDSAEIKVLQRAIRNFRRRIATMRALINNRISRLKALFESATPIERAYLESLMRRKILFQNSCRSWIVLIWLLPTRMLGKKSIKIGA